MHAISKEAPAELALVLHFHQPVGNFGQVFEKVTEQCYAPLLEMLFEFPELKTHLHFNGILLDWFDQHRPDLIRHLDRMVRRGSVELLTGGHQEPILAVLPEEDAVGQVRALSLELEQRFGQNPVGAWLTERVWEPRLPTPLVRAGVRYVILDDAIFRWAGVDGDALLGHYVTDDIGRPLALFPGAKSLRYTIPFRPPQETFDLLHALPTQGDAPPLMVYADDAEKFGEWPGTHEWVFEKGWLRRFLEQLRDDEKVRTVHLRERLAEHAPLGRIYPPTASYPEMTVWAMPTPARAHMEDLVHRLEESDPQGLLPYLRGGQWRGFFAKYPEVNRLHKRMLRVSRRYDELKTRGVDDERLGQALRDLYRGQCNDAYWHGVFGGIYLPHLRRALESFLIRAERALDALDRGHFDWEASRRVDFDADGAEEIELTTPAAQVVVDPIGGRLLSWDLREACDNWVTVMQRHEEPFHASLFAGDVIHVDEEGLPLNEDDGKGGVATIHGAVRVKPGVAAEDLAVDRHSRVAGLLWAADVDAVVDDPRRIENYARPLRGAWDSRIEESKAACALRTQQEGLRILQEIRLSRGDASLELELEVEPTEGPCRLFAEWNLFVGWTGDDLEIDRDGAWLARAEGEHVFEDAKDGLPALSVRGGGGRQLRIETNVGTLLHWAPVHTVSSSEAGLEKIGQGSCFLFEWEIHETTRIRLRLVPDAPALADEPIDSRSPR